MKFIIILPVLVVSALIWKLEIFNIKQVFLEINNAECISEQILKEELNLTGKNILIFDEENLRRKIIDKFPCIKEINLERNFPQNVKILLSGKNALAKVISYVENPDFLNDLEATPSSQAALLDVSFSAFDQKQLLVDETGFIFGDFKKDVPFLYWPEKDLFIGQQLDKSKFEKISQIFYKFKELSISFTKSKVIEDSLFIQSQQQTIFSLKKDALRQLASLQLILQKAKIEDKSMKSIDLRFDKPVVIYNSQD